MWGEKGVSGVTPVFLAWVTEWTKLPRAEYYEESRLEGGVGGGEGEFQELGFRHVMFQTIFITSKGRYCQDRHSPCLSGNLYPSEGEIPSTTQLRDNLTCHIVLGVVTVMWWGVVTVIVDWGWPQWAGDGRAETQDRDSKAKFRRKEWA